MLKHLRKHFPQAAFVLVVLGLGFAAAANITKSVQLSQDPSGPIGFDTQNSVYFPAHVNGSGVAPAIAGFGTSAAIVGTDLAGEITLGTTPGIAGTLTFRVAFTSTPYCTGSTTTPTAIGFRPSPNGMIVSHSILASDKIYYHCLGGQSG